MNTGGRGAVPLVEFYVVLRGHHWFEIQNALRSGGDLSIPKVFSFAGRPPLCTFGDFVAWFKAQTASGVLKLSDHLRANNRPPDDSDVLKFFIPLYFKAMLYWISFSKRTLRAACISCCANDRHRHCHHRRAFLLQSVRWSRLWREQCPALCSQGPSGQMRMWRALRSQAMR